MSSTKLGPRIREVVRVVGLHPGLTPYALVRKMDGGTERGNYAAIVRARLGGWVTVRDGKLHLPPAEVRP